MSITFRKESHLLSIAQKAALLVTCTALMAASASAQSYASSNAAISYSFQLDPNSAGLGAFLSVQDGGESTFNLINSSGLPYTATSGATASADAIVSTNTKYNGYDPTSMSWSGYNGIYSNATETGTPGSATSSVGSQETLFIQNTGVLAITLDLTATANCYGTASETGPASATNYASTATYTDIGDYDYGTGVFNNPQISSSGTAASGVNTGATSEWTPLSPVYFGPGAYAGTYTMTIAAGDTHALEFYVMSEDNAFAAVPNTPGLATLAIGLLGLMVRRKRTR